MHITELQVLGLALRKYNKPYVWLNIKGESGPTCDVTLPSVAANDEEG